MAYLHHDPAPRRPLSRDEKWIASVFFLVFFGALAGELLRDFSPVKLGLVFVVLSWLPLLILHELGHAFMARYLGWHVSEIVIGTGRDLLRFRYGDTLVSFKLAPLIGHVRTVPTDLKSARLKQALVYAAGPLAELALVLVLWLVLGDELLTRSTDTGVIAVQSLALTAMLGAVLNLVPFSLPGGGVSDGLGVILSFFTPRKQFEWQLAGPWVERVERLRDADQLPQALEVAELGLLQLPEHPRLRLARALCFAARGDDAAAVAELEGFGELSELDPGTREQVLEAGAEVALYAGTRERLLDARRLADLALGVFEGASASAAAAWLKGAALVQLGQLQVGVEQLEQASKLATSDAELEWCYAWLAVGYSRLGISQRAQDYLAELASRGPSVRMRRLLAEVDSKLGAPPRAPDSVEDP